MIIITVSQASPMGPILPPAIAPASGSRRLPPFHGRHVHIRTLHPEAWRNTLHQSTQIRLAAPWAGRAGTIRVLY